MNFLHANYVTCAIKIWVSMSNPSRLHQECQPLFFGKKPKPNVNLY